MDEDERGDAFRGIPKLRPFVVLEFYLVVPWASPSLGSFHSLFHNPSNLYPKHENFTTQNSTEDFMSSVSIRQQTTTQGTVMNSFFIYIGIKPTVFQLLYGSYPPPPRYYPWMHQNKQTTHEKQNLSKTEHSVENL